MEQKQRNTLLAAGILSGVLSLPMSWLTLGVAGRFGPMNAAMGNMTMNITGLNGKLSLLFLSIPIWFVILLAVAANALQFDRMIDRMSDFFVIPRALVWTLAVVSQVWIVIPVLLVVASKGVRPGFGWFLGVICAGAAITSLMFQGNGRLKKRPKASSSNYLPDELPGLRETDGNS